MKLSSYVKQIAEVSISEAARQLGEHRETVRLWVEEKSIPRKEQMSKIFLWSAGAVTPNDFYPLPDLALAGAELDQLEMFSAGVSSENPPSIASQNSIRCVSAPHSRIPVNQLSTGAAQPGASRG